MSKRVKKRKFPVPVLVFLLVLVVILLIAGALFGRNIQDMGNDMLYPLEYEAVIYQYAEEYGLDPFLVMGLIRAESSYQVDALSGAGAMGLMQIMPETGRWLAERMGLEGFDQEQLYNPVYNIRMGCYYLSMLLEWFDIQDTAIAAYNAGQGNVRSWLEDSQYSGDGINLDDIPYQETRDYVQRVNEYMEKYRELYGPEA